jgi:alpha-beta hydrolase superfamily lysophospholipase
VGAEHDVIVSQRQIRRTAAVYDAEAEVYPNMGHDMMLEPGWLAVAERIHMWLEARHPDQLQRPEYGESIVAFDVPKRAPS